MSLEILEFGSEEQEEMADGLSGVIGLRLGRFLDEYVEAHNLGWVFNADTDFELPNIGKRRPDVAFCSFETLPTLPRTVIPVPPDLAVEITSSRDEIDNSDKKLNEYRQVPLKLVWIVRPVGQIVEVYRADGTASIITAEGVLKGDEVIKGFELPLSRLFTLPRQLIR